MKLLWLIICVGVMPLAGQAQDKGKAVVEAVAATELVTLEPKARDNTFKFHVSDNAHDLDVTISNFQGRPLVHRTYTAGKYTKDLSINTPYLNPGVYYLTFETTGYKTVKQAELVNDY